MSSDDGDDGNGGDKTEDGDGDGERQCSMFPTNDIGNANDKNDDVVSPPPPYPHSSIIRTLLHLRLKIPLLFARCKFSCKRLTDLGPHDLRT